jgi:hypothetical protein
LFGDENNLYKVEVRGGIDAQSAFTGKSVDPVVVDESETLEHIEQLVSKLARSENKTVVLPVLMTKEAFLQKLETAGSNLIGKINSGKLQVVGLSSELVADLFSNEKTKELNSQVLNGLLVNYAGAVGITRDEITSVSIMSARPLSINRNDARLIGIQIIRLVIAMEVEVIDVERNMKTEQIVFIQA